MKYLYSWLTGVLLASALTPAAAANDVNISFNQHPLQTYTGALLRHDWANLVWDGTRQRAHIATDGKDNNARFLRVSRNQNAGEPIFVVCITKTPLNIPVGFFVSIRTPHPNYRTMMF